MSSGIRSTSLAPAPPAPSVLASQAKDAKHVDLARKPEELQEQSRSRLDGLAGKIGKGMLGTAIAVPALPLIAGAYTLSKVAMLPTYGLAKLYDAAKGLGEAQGKANTLREQLGHPKDNGIMGKSINTSSGDQKISELMNDYRVQLNSKASQDEMNTYINMGERIISALNDTDQSYEGGTITVAGKDGPYEVRPNLDTARAVSWFLQAKALEDNAGTNRAPVTLNRGSMVAEDPEGKLFKFLKSAPNTYGRASTHFNERSTEKAGFKNTGLAGGMINLANRFKNLASSSGKPLQAAQHGIEDFSSKFPSGKGCLLFNKLVDDDNQQQQQIFLKWESSGMPNFVNPTSTHADPESGLSGKIANRFGAFDRCLAHTLNFLKLGRSSGNWSIHREAVHKGAPGEHYHRFGSIMKSLETIEGKNDHWSKNLIAEAKIKGVDFMLEVLQGFQDVYLESDQNNVHVDQLITDIGNFKTQQGNDLGIRRKGAEVHVNLS